MSHRVILRQDTVGTEQTAGLAGALALTLTLGTAGAAEAKDLPSPPHREGQTRSVSQTTSHDP